MNRTGTAALYAATPQPLEIAQVPKHLRDADLLAEPRVVDGFGTGLAMSLSAPGDRIFVYSGAVFLRKDAEIPDQLVWDCEAIDRHHLGHQDCGGQFADTRDP